MKSFPKKFAEYARLRAANAERIFASAEDFKVCSFCFSISLKRAAICPLCHGYRWHEDAPAVKLIAKITQLSPLPFTAGVAPRLAEVEVGGKGEEVSHRN